MRLGIGLGIGRASGGPSRQQQIAREAASPTRINTWHVFGSSRCTSIHQFLLANCATIPWSGVALLGAGATTTGQRVTVVGKVGGVSTTDSPEIGGTQNWFPQNCSETVSLGAAAGVTIHANRIAATEVSAALFPYLFSRLTSGVVRGRGTFYRHAAGVDCSSDPSTYLGPRFYMPTSNLNAWEAAGGTAAAYTTDTLGSGYGYVETTVAAGIDWAALGTARANWAVDAAPRQAYPTDQIFSIDHAVLNVELPGAVVCNYSVGGATMPRWSNPDIIADAVFTGLLPLKGPNPVCLLEAASTVGAFPDYATVAGYLDATVARFQWIGSYVPTMVFTGYPNYLSGGVNPEWHQWIETWCASTPYPVLFLPTHDVRSYDECVALGFFSADETPGDEGDKVHAGPLGNRLFATDIENLILAAAV
jgi:hypothetical protein